MAVLSGCSAMRIVYSQAPDLSYWWLDGYVDFNGAQTPRVHEALNQFFAWHRQTQLPDYAALLARAETELLADTTPAQVCRWQPELLARVKTAFDRAAPSIADLMLTITPEQIRHLERRYAKYNEEFASDYLQPDPRDREAETLKRTLDRVESLYGRLDDAQRARIAANLKRSPFDPEIWLTERRQRQQDALQLLRQLRTENANREQALAGLRVYAQRMENSPREAYRRYDERLTEFNCAFAASLHNSTTPAQRRYAADKLAGWEGDLRALTVAPAPGNPIEPGR